MWSRWALLGGLLCSACSTPAPTPVAPRASLSRTGGTTFELLPAAGQHPFCLAYTVSKSGLTRQLTMSPSNQSFECPAGKPVGQHAYRVPLNEGPVRVYVLFTSQAVNAASVSQQLLDATDRQRLSVMSLRLPGAATLEALDFSPIEDVAPEVGGVIGAGDGGTP